MSVYFCSIKVHTLGLGKPLEAFPPPAGLEAFSLQRIVEMVDEVVSVGERPSEYAPSLHEMLSRLDWTGLIQSSG